MTRLTLNLLFILCYSGAWAQPLVQAPLESPYSQPEYNGREPLPKPNTIDDEGTYFYKDTPAKDAIYYKPDHIPTSKNAVFTRFGTIGPFDIIGDAGKSYKEVYSDSASFLFSVDYEWLLANMVGKWTLKFSSGITIEEGSGTFSSAANVSLTPKESFSFWVMPNVVLLNYKMRYSDRQWFVPYIEGGGGYFTFIENRSDGGKQTFGGAAALAFGGGLLVNLSHFDRYTTGMMYEDYGVTDLWFDVNVRRNQGFGDKNFSSNMITAGFGFGF